MNNEGRIVDGEFIFTYSSMFIDFENPDTEHQCISVLPEIEVLLWAKSEALEQA